MLRIRRVNTTLRHSSYIYEDEVMLVGYIYCVQMYRISYAYWTQYCIICMCSMHNIIMSCIMCMHIMPCMYCAAYLYCMQCGIWVLWFREVIVRNNHSHLDSHRDIRVHCIRAVHMLYTYIVFIPSTLNMYMHNNMHTLRTYALYSAHMTHISYMH